MSKREQVAALAPRCPECGRAAEVSCMRRVMESVDLPTGKVVRRDVVGWSDDFECACGAEWTDAHVGAALRALPVDAYDEPECGLGV